MEPIWHDREIRFDCSSSQINLRKGEVLVDTLPNIEDTKGNQDEAGTMKVTNLRLIWYCDANPYINLSIGYNSIANHEVKVNYSGASGNT
jgi:Bardet-Biedl syndrome 5 protein